MTFKGNINMIFSSENIKRHEKNSLQDITFNITFMNVWNKIFINVTRKKDILRNAE